MKALLLFFLFQGMGCVHAYRQSIGGESTQSFERIYRTDFNTAWQAVLDSLKQSRMDITNRESGYIQTKWTDNTSEKNFTDSHGGADAYLKAQFRFKVSLAKGFYNGTPTVRISTIKEQLVQRDVLEGWKIIETDSIDETTLLYRIGRLIYVKTKLQQIEEEKAKKQIENSGF